MDGDSSPLDGFGSLLRLSGYSVPARARFVGECMFSGFYTSVTLGLVCGQVGAACTPYGPIVPFLVGAGAGFCAGLYSSFRQSVRLTVHYARSYPRILAHALWVEHRIIAAPTCTGVGLQQQQHNREMITEQWVTGNGIGHLSMCILAAQGCRSDVDEVDRQERQRLIEAQVTALAAKNNDDDDPNETE
jgi:hypothetical protein